MSNRACGRIQDRSGSRIRDEGAEDGSCPKPYSPKSRNSTDTEGR